MIIEYELQGSKCLHKGIFETTGFWLRNEPHGEDLSNPEGWKLYSHSSFAFYHENKEIFDLVYARLISVLRGSASVEIENIGYFRKLNK